MYWVCGITFAFCPRVLCAPALNCSLRLLFNLHSGKVPVYSVCPVWSHIVGGCQIDRFIGGLRCSFASLPPPLTSPRLHSPYHLHGSPSTTTFPVTSTDNRPRASQNPTDTASTCGADPYRWSLCDSSSSIILLDNCPESSSVLPRVEWASQPTNIAQAARRRPPPSTPHRNPPRTRTHRGRE